MPRQSVGKILKSPRKWLRDLASVHDEADTTPMVYTMDKFTVNLGGEPKRTIRLEINLQMLGKEGFEEVMELKIAPNSRPYRASFE